MNLLTIRPKVCRSHPWRQVAFKGDRCYACKVVGFPRRRIKVVDILYILIPVIILVVMGIIGKAK